MIFLFFALLFFVQDKIVSHDVVPRCHLILPDTAVADIRIEDSESLLRVIGSEPLLNDDDLPNVSYLSQDKKKTLTLFFHPGSTANAFSEFEVRYTKKFSNKNLLNGTFRTNSGIELGISKIDVISKL